MDEEKHNIKHMFTLFNTTSDISVTFTAIRSALQALELEILQLRFQPMETHDMSLKMLDSLDSFTQSQMMSFFEIYGKVVCLVAKQQWSVQKADAIKTMDSRKDKIDEGYQKRHITVDQFTEFYNQLAQYYKENGEDMKAAWCHTHILSTIHGQLKHCSPDCDYWSISQAYKKIENRKVAFAFRELAYQHQLPTLSPMVKAMLILTLYSDYMDPSVGNNETKANGLSRRIIGEIYYNILYPPSAEVRENSEIVYYTAINFFQNKGMDEHVSQLQYVMYTIVTPCAKYYCDDGSLKRGDYFDRIVSHAKIYEKDPTKLMSTCEFKCAAHYADLAQEAYNRKCYLLAIWAGEQSSANLDKLGESYTLLKYRPESIIGRSYYEIGKNHSATVMALNRALPYMNSAIRFEYTSFDLKYERAELCEKIIATNWMHPNVLCYIYILKDCLVIAIPYFYAVHIPTYWHSWFTEEIILSEETGLTEQKYNFIWSQFEKLHYDLYIQKVLSGIITVIPITLTILYYFICICVFYHCTRNTLHFYFRFIHTRLRTLFILTSLIVIFTADLL